jgi:hypothetical protein
MWINRQTFDRLLKVANDLEKALTSSEGIRQTYVEQNRVLQVNLDWLRTRVNQLEHERAQLLWNYVGVKIAVPEIQRAERVMDTVTHPLTELPSFEDMGDEEAKRQGVSWNEEGRVTYR